MFDSKLASKFGLFSKVASSNLDHVSQFAPNEMFLYSNKLCCILFSRPKFASKPQNTLQILFEIASLWIKSRPGTATNFVEMLLVEVVEYLNSLV